MLARNYIHNIAETLKRVVRILSLLITLLTAGEDTGQINSIQDSMLLQRRKSHIKGNTTNINITWRVLTASDNVLTTQQIYTGLCVGTIAQGHFTPGRPPIISLPMTEQAVTHKSFPGTLPHRDNLQMLVIMLKNLNERTTWPIWR
jgi:hypothetical protein